MLKCNRSESNFAIYNLTDSLLIITKCATDYPYTMWMSCGHLDYIHRIHHLTFTRTSDDISSLISLQCLDDQISFFLDDLLMMIISFWLESDDLTIFAKSFGVLCDTRCKMFIWICDSDNSMRRHQWSKKRKKRICWIYHVKDKIAYNVLIFCLVVELSIGKLI